jgi:hypothetical protein
MYTYFSHFKMYVASAVFELGLHATSDAAQQDARLLIATEILSMALEIPDLRVFTEPEFLPTEKAPSTFFQFFVPFHSFVR